MRDLSISLKFSNSSCVGKLTLDIQKYIVSRAIHAIFSLLYRLQEEKTRITKYMYDIFTAYLHLICSKT